MIRGRGQSELRSPSVLGTRAQVRRPHGGGATSQRTVEQRIVLTDGVHGVVDDRTLQGMVADSDIRRRSPTGWFRRRSNRGSRDNCTAVVGRTGLTAELARVIPAHQPGPAHRPRKRL